MGASSIANDFQNQCGRLSGPDEGKFFDSVKNVELHELTTKEFLVPSEIWRGSGVV